MNVLAWDFDGTLCDEAMLAMPHMVSKIREQFEDRNNFIVIYTARSIGQYHIIHEWLRANGVPFHALVCEKMRATKYYDDKAVTA